MPRGTSYIIYDIPGNATKYRAWSSNVWKTRFRVWMDVRRQDCPQLRDHTTQDRVGRISDIGAVAQRIGAPDTVLLHGGQPLYTVPILRDPTTERNLSGSLQIALNLERMYPDAPLLFPRGTEDAIIPFDAQFTHSVGGALAPLLLVHIWAQLNEGSKPYFRTARERMLGQSLESLTPPGAQTAARCARHSSRSRKMRTHAGSRTCSCWVSARRTRTSSRRVGWPPGAGSRVRTRKSGRSWRRGMGDGGGGWRVHSRDGSMWIPRLRLTLQNVEGLVCRV
ncbi:hypothetical protein EDB92DRAFT_1819110 [Lactarius akahatsu]|uniref:Glutathione S-transferase UstS-like C-terminal domain-containing protein n=1 Tax=Lactarius akahatsu TaxID=416441 RepID=A0AAD4Q7H1_9AGAM|nr:hypothetical protein EDB92DRAFT_1819110 [Lactarius akahatsu]